MPLTHYILHGQQLDYILNFTAFTYRVEDLQCVKNGLSYTMFLVVVIAAALWVAFNCIKRYE